MQKERVTPTDTELPPAGDTASGNRKRWRRSADPLRLPAQEAQDGNYSREWVNVASSIRSLRTRLRMHEAS